MKMFSANKVIGYLVYQTRKALNENARFKEAVKVYSLHPTCFSGNYFNLWHYPGTSDEISGVFKQIDKVRMGGKLKFPAILNFNPIKQVISESKHTVYYNLAFIAPVENDWKTDRRDNEVFEPLLRWVYSEFINQIQKSGIIISYGTPAHTYHEVFSTDDRDKFLIERYGAYIDAIELHNLTIDMKQLCDNQIQKIYEFDKLVFKDINELIIN
ncbi:hypothetical protein IR083_20940 [Dysgonomonas sp. GY75]|uniref:hypothetical protein n=1 Tax=Dysgonomonas sp. GY75 TaxID=2780419 RepID=UPI00188313D1|nr:hypothetical protein [Dysgonomonas sp. GY75]MBF0651289.1 hypothetical protein [Dysgonomonas sp. GY75]